LPVKALVPLSKATLVERAPSAMLLLGKITPPPEIVRPLADDSPPAPLICKPPRKVEVLADCKRMVPELVISPEVLMTNTFGIWNVPLVEILPDESMYNVPEAWVEETLRPSAMAKPASKVPDDLRLPDGSMVKAPPKKPVRLPMERPW